MSRQIADDTQLIPAAQYLRMSTEHQQYSFANQRTVIEEYAARNGYAVVCSYEDAGKSGLALRRREGLQRLLNDVVAGSVAFKAILVYDVSQSSTQAWYLSSSRFRDPPNRPLNKQSKRKRGSVPNS